MQHRDIIAETTALQGILDNPGSALEVVGHLSVECFTDAAYQTIFEAIQIVALAGQEPNIISINKALRGAKAAKAIKDAAIQAVAEFTGIVSRSKLRAATGRLNALKEGREVSAAITQVALVAEDRPEMAKARFIEEAMRLSLGSTTGGYTPISELIMPTIDLVQEAMAANAREELPPDTIPSGFSHLDKVCGGFRKGQTIIIGADTGVGKTKTAQQILLNVARRGHPCYHTFMEETREEVCLKYACSIAGVDVTKALTGEIRKDQQAVKRLMDGFAELDRLPITINESSEVSHIISNYKRWILALTNSNKEAEGEKLTPFFVLDYIGLIERMPRLSREESIAEITKKLHRCAVQDKIVFLALTQLNGKHKERGDKRPQKGDSFGSRAVEKYATILLYLHDPTEYFEVDPETNLKYPKGYREMIVAKGRFGGRGIVSLQANMATGQITQGVKLGGYNPRPSNQGGFSNAF